MPCYHPIDAWRSANPQDWSNGPARMVFRPELGLPSTHVKLPCGQCIGCRLARARTWAIRCMHESTLHAQNCFLTLTYNNENLPPHSSLRPDDIVKFFKRLRKSGAIIRYLQCGEYGELNARPHHHCIIFGWAPPDCVLYRAGDIPLYQSAFLSKLWPYGFVSVGSVTFDSCCYVARYVTKKVTGAKAAAYYGLRIPEYITMSRRPGIGKAFYDEYFTDMYSHDMLVVRDKFVVKPPRYYDKLYDIDNPDKMRDIRLKRLEAVKSLPELDYKRQEVLDMCQRLKLARNPRKMESLP
ncbi:MAG: replication initiator protein [Microvirus sp.]|nr:MAG: replication initiator protein [Microvirus sp.]